MWLYAFTLQISFNYILTIFFISFFLKIFLIKYWRNYHLRSQNSKINHWFWEVTGEGGGGVLVNEFSFVSFCFYWHGSSGAKILQLPEHMAKMITMARCRLVLGNSFKREWKRFLFFPGTKILLLRERGRYLPTGWWADSVQWPDGRRDISPLDSVVTVGLSLLQLTPIHHLRTLAVLQTLASRWA